MNMDVLEKFTDQEKVTAFNVALKVSKEKNVDFSRTFKMVISQIIDSKKAKEVTGKEEIKEEKQTELNLEVLNTIFAKIREDRNRIHDELFKRISDYTKTRGIFSPASDLAFMAGDGVIIDPKFIERFQLGPVDPESLNEQQNIKEDLLRYNEKSRELLYLSNKYRDEESLEKARLKNINLYSELIDKAKHNLEDGTIKVEKDESNISFSKMIEYLRKEGKASKGGVVDTAFDELYSASFSYATIGTNRIRSEKLYNEMLTLLNERKDKLEHMNAEDFRKYKITLINLDDKEIDKFNNDFDSKKAIVNNRNTTYTIH
ncbi:MAG: hypothetical protein IJ568_05980 [Bacilli bacterium]|nr:hypothetical protein [Bacilli bacterium]